MESRAVSLPYFELEVRSGGYALFRGLAPCALPGSHEYRIPAAEVEALAQAFRDEGLFDISRMPRRRGRVFHAGQRVLVYRSSGRIASCRVEDGLAYSFYTLPKRWGGGGTELLLEFDDGERCTRARWFRTQ